jgi:hypothetical protein
MADPSDASDAPWLTLSEAAAQSGRHIGALRSMVRRKSLPARKGNGGAWLVQLPDELQANPDALTGSAGGSASSPIGSPYGDAMAELLAEVAELRDQLGRAIGRAEGQERLITQLQDDLAHARAELAQARRPWWRKLLG